MQKDFHFAPRFVKYAKMHYYIIKVFGVRLRAHIYQPEVFTTVLSTK